MKETPCTAVVDGHDGMGQVIGYKSMQMAIDKAKKYGMGMVAVRNSCHYGIAGYYATMATKQGCIGITGTNARPSVAPTFGVEGMFGTNPLTIGIPTDEDFDFVIDCATSITQNGKIEYYERIGEDVHPGTIIGKDGKEISGDAGEALKKIRSGDAALTTLGGIGEALGGYKGYGYAMVIELLSAVLQDGNYGKALNGKDENGNLVKTEVHKFFGKEWAHTIGTAYGYIVNKFQMTQNLIDKIKNHPEDRRMVMTLWQNDYLIQRYFRAVYGQANGMLPTESLTAGYISVLVMFRLVYHLMLRNMQHFFVCLHRFAV